MLIPTIIMGVIAIVLSPLIRRFSTCTVSQSNKKDFKEF